MLFMKGNKMFPQCGFSNTAVQVCRTPCMWEVSIICTPGVVAKFYPTIKLDDLIGPNMTVSMFSSPRRLEGSQGLGGVLK